MQKRFYSTFIATVLAVAFCALPVHAAQKKASKPAHGKAAVVKPHAKTAKATKPHGATPVASKPSAKKGQKAVASTPAARKRAGAKPALAAGKGQRKPGHAGTRIGNRKANASKGATPSKVAARKHAAKPRKVKKATR
jgi:hypothetical protein